MAENKTAASRRRFLRTGGLAALFGFASAATVTHAAQHGASVSPALADLIEKHRAAALAIGAGAAC
ncbi:hypothetical protein [Methylocella sp.]|uniref:hypothetical protein n=1 Tax=Methylocella sp. TaxID=1978226 RepID=UPI0035AE12E2